LLNSAIVKHHWSRTEQFIVRIGRASQKNLIPQGVGFFFFVRARLVSMHAHNSLWKERIIPLYLDVVYDGKMTKEQLIDKYKEKIQNCVN
jgi:hypothetical protein